MPSSAITGRHRQRAARRRSLDPLRRRHAAQPHRRGGLRTGRPPGDRRARAVACIGRGTQGALLDGDRRHDAKNDYSPVYWQIYEVSGLAAGRAAADRPPAAAGGQPTTSRRSTGRTTASCSPPTGRATATAALPTARRVRIDADRHRHLVDGAPTAPTCGCSTTPPSGDFTPLVASDGRVIFTRWDHLQRDQQNNEGTLDAMAPSTTPPERAPQQLTDATPRSSPSCAASRRAATSTGTRSTSSSPGRSTRTVPGSRRSTTSAATSCAGYFDSAHDGLPEFIAPEDRRTADLFLQLEEDPLRPGYFYGTNAPEFATHAAGQIIGLDAPEVRQRRRHAGRLHH